MQRLLQLQCRGWSLSIAGMCQATLSVLNQDLFKVYSILIILFVSTNVTLTIQGP